MLNMVPDNALITESSLTLDSLYTFLRQTVQKSRLQVKAGRPPLKLDFDSDYLKRGSSSVERQTSKSAGLTYSQKGSGSIWSKEMDRIATLGTEVEREEAVMNLAADIEKMIFDAANKGQLDVSGVPDTKYFKDFNNSYTIDYKGFTVSGFKNSMAGFLGFTGYDEMLKFADGEERVEDQVFDDLIRF